MTGYSIYQLDHCNGAKSFVVASSDVASARVFSFVVSAGMPRIVDVKRLGPVLATMLDAVIIPDADFEQTVRSNRGGYEDSRQLSIVEPN